MKHDVRPFVIRAKSYKAAAVVAAEMDLALRHWVLLEDPYAEEASVYVITDANVFMQHDVFYTTKNPSL